MRCRRRQNSADESHDLSPVLKTGAPSPRRTIVHNTNPNGYALRPDQWLLVAAKTGAISKVPAWFDQANNDTPNDQPGELFDLSRDLAPRDNLYALQPAKVAELRVLLEGVRQRGQVR